VLFAIDRFLCGDLPGYGTPSRVVISLVFTWEQSKLLFWALCWVLKLSGGRSRVRGLSLWQYLEGDRQSGRVERKKCRYRGSGKRSDFVEWPRTILELWKESTIKRCLFWEKPKTRTELEVSSRIVKPSSFIQIHQTFGDTHCSIYPVDGISSIPRNVGKSCNLSLLKNDKTFKFLPAYKDLKKN